MQLMFCCTLPAPASVCYDKDHAKTLVPPGHGAGTSSLLSEWGLDSAALVRTASSPDLAVGGASPPAAPGGLLVMQAQTAQDAADGR